MTELLTAAQMRALEQAAIESGQVTGLELMERAGAGVVEAVFEQWPELRATSHRAVVLCGPGNNGGDGFVVARLLKEWGWTVDVVLYGAPDKLPPDARVNYQRWREIGEITARAIAPAPLRHDSLHLPREFDLLIDSLFGTGLARPLQGVAALFTQPDVAAALQSTGARVVAVDMPSGLCSDSGKGLRGSDETGVHRATIQADLTVTFHGLKAGHILAEGPDVCGKVVVKSIGLPGSPRPMVPPGEWVRLIEREDVDVAKHCDHKYTHGHALILSGGAGHTGAARLAARGALRVGAGLVTLGVPGAAQMEVASQITALMLRRVEDAVGLEALLEDTRFNALCLGPGLGVGDERALLVEAALKSGRATVLDADALSLVGRDPALFALLHKGCVLTPHGGEFARLFPDIAEKLNAPAKTGPAYSKVDAAREAAARAGCVVLFKGPDTVIAAPDGRCSICAAVYDRAAPWLATAGSGDVLAGFITGLLARGFAPMQAAETAAWLHVECARSFGPGLIAEDLPEQLPQLFRTLGI